MKVNVLELLFTLSFEFLRHLTFYNSFRTRREQWKWAAEMTYNSYKLKNQQISMVIPLKESVLNAADYILPLKSNCQK